MAEIIDGKKIAEELRNEVKAETEQLKKTKGITPGLAFILVGENPASQVYVKMKGKACEEMGFYSITERMPENTSEQILLDKILEFNNDAKVHGILVQLPLPKHINEAKVLELIKPSKDVDGFHPYNVGKLVVGEDTLKPCTPAG
ncbi:MAG TPA: tetrahydrofolate dehydrogenase/cyclohydrolase catalytic domain-containing protein, partial [Bacteroidota bacterium]